MTNEPRTPSEIVKHLSAERAPRTPGCGGRGYYRNFDTDYDCGGCPSCDWASRLGYVIADAATLDFGAALRARCETALVAYTALCAIGRAMASALAIGAAVQAFVIGATAAWNTVGKGRWYRVEGKRGNAKKVHGAIGQCMGVYTEDRTSRYGSYSYGTTTKAALKIDGHDKLVYVTIANLEPVTEPEDMRAARIEREAQKALERAARPAFPARLAGKSGATGNIVSGPHTGKAGKVFWYGEKAGGPRVGVKLCACSKRCSCQVAWCSAHDVVVAEAR
jgi:hypothetical protein